MPAMDKVTGMKVCTKCGVPKRAKDHFFASQAMSDGYASRCKDCWNIRGSATPPAGGATSVVGLPFRPQYRHPAAVSAHTHTREEVRRIEQTDQRPCVGYATIGGTHVPVFGIKEPDWLDKGPTR